MTDQLCNCCVAVACQEYRRRNGCFPSHVIIFRDGVSEGQYNTVLQTEVKQMQDALNNLNPSCQISFVCVNKRIITRLISTDRDRLSNPVSGTTVHQDIVNAHVPQFFLVSQSTTQGTVSPTSYDIILNHKEWCIEDFQKLTYKLCHLYYNWTVSVTSPMPPYLTRPN